MSPTRFPVWAIHTPEGVAFRLRLASPLLRLLAWLIDSATVAVAWSLVSGLFAWLNLLSRDLAGALAILGFFLLTQGYRIVAEWRWRGQTLGKRVLRLRVVDGEGLPLTLSQILLRNLLRLIDALPALYLVGGLTAFINRRGQRLGDLAAGTLVIWEPVHPPPDLSALTPLKHNSLRQHPSLVARLRQGLTAEQGRAACQALLRREQMDDTARLEVFRAIAATCQSLAPWPAELRDALSDEALVRAVVDALYLSGPQKR